MEERVGIGQKSIAIVFRQPVAVSGKRLDIVFWEWLAVGRKVSARRFNLFCAESPHDK